MIELFVALYLGAAGFVFAGIVGSFCQLVTGAPLSFEVEMRSMLHTLGNVLLVGITGPFIVSRLVLGRAVQKSLNWGVALVGGTVIAMWSVTSGLIVVHIALSIA